MSESAKDAFTFTLFDVPEQQLLRIVQAGVGLKLINTGKWSSLGDAGPVRQQPILAYRLDRLRRQKI
jgi:hypothetical protein